MYALDTNTVAYFFKGMGGVGSRLPNLTGVSGSTATSSSPSLHHNSTAEPGTTPTTTTSVSPTNTGPGITGSGG